jgi:hypothetical protein
MLILEPPGEDYMQSPINWLLEGSAFIQYRTRIDLLGEGDLYPDVQSVRRAMLLQPEIREMVNSLQDWPGKVLASHKSANQSFHTLNFLTDLGLRIDDDGISRIAEKILAQTSPEGPFRLAMNIGEGHGGNGQDSAGWALCDAPNLVYALIQLGLGDDPQVIKAADYLTSLVRDNGWPCAVSKELGNFHGPGSKSSPCPYANLVMLKILSTKPEWINHPAAVTGIETILHLWKNRQDEHPFIFYMGTDFCKLKAPLIWYDILHVLDVLSRYPMATQSDGYKEMLEIVRSKMTGDGVFVAESVYLPYKSWDFGQKKQPSRWITLLVYRILARTEKSRAK